MSDTLSVWDEILKTIQTLTTGPLIVFYLVLLFRQALTEQIPGLFRSLEALAARLVSLKYKGIEADFQMQALRKFAAAHSPELSKQVLLRIGLPSGDAAASPRILRSAAVESDAVSPVQEKVISALSSDPSSGKALLEISAETGQSLAVVDAALTQLLQTGRVQPMMNPKHDIVFGLRA